MNYADFCFGFLAGALTTLLLMGAVMFRAMKPFIKQAQQKAQKHD